MDAASVTDDLSSRLATYTWRRWLSNGTVSPLECCRYGWICVERDLLQCVGCKQYLGASAHRPSAGGATLAERRWHWDAVAKLKDAIVSAHDSTCNWRTNPTPETSFEPNVFDRDSVITELASRLDSLKPVDFAQPSFAHRPSWECH